MTPFRHFDQLPPAVRLFLLPADPHRRNVNHYNLYFSPPATLFLSKQIKQKWFWGMIVTALMVGSWIVYAIFYQDLGKALNSLEHKDQQEELLVTKLQQELAALQKNCGVTSTLTDTTPTTPTTTAAAAPVLPGRATRGQQPYNEDIQREALLAQLQRTRKEMEEMERLLRQMTL